MVVDEIKKKFDGVDFESDMTVFKGNMKLIIKMPQCGKKTTTYWTSMGWSEYEAEDRRIKIKRDPHKSPMNINFWINKGY